MNVEEVKDVVMSRATSKFRSANGCVDTPPSKTANQN